VVGDKPIGTIRRGESRRALLTQDRQDVRPDPRNPVLPADCQAMSEVCEAASPPRAWRCRALFGVAINRDAGSSRAAKCAEKMTSHSSRRS